MMFALNVHLHTDLNNGGGNRSAEEGGHSIVFATTVGPEDTGKFFDSKNAAQDMALPLNTIA